jgi:hypothetical protein
MSEYNLTVKQRLVALLATHSVGGLVGMAVMYAKPEIAPHVVVVVLCIAGRSTMAVWKGNNVQPKVGTDKD